MTTRPPVVLSIAGSDPSGGAGIQADLKTFSALGAYGTTVITALTAQSTTGVTGVHLPPAAFVTEQLVTLVADVRIDAVKIGMLSSRDTADAVGAFLVNHPPAHVVLDPVMVATSGDRLIDDDAVDALRRLLPLASLITPNLPESAALLGCQTAKGVDEMLVQAHRLRGAGALRVLVKGGHDDTEGPAVDVFVGPEGEHVLSAPWIATRNTHGTGCTLSSAIAALLPQRPGYVEAVSEAKTWLNAAIAAADILEIGRPHGHGPVHHFHQTWGAR
ncbi:bifunctional hydroxymethylpyrimidine kinase/phosphomethylpyrimidine kinase [Dermatophilaceae bacterium Soc4.6]